MKILKNKDIILFSKSLIWELKKDYGEEIINKLLNILFFSGTLIEVEIKKEEYMEAKKLSKEKGIPFIDCLNAVQARNNNAVIISQDEHFRKHLLDIAKTIKPQDL